MVDRRVRLDRVDEVVARHGQGRDGAAGRGDDANRERVRVVERAPDRSDRLADDGTRGIAERHRRERMRPRVDAEEPDVVEEIPADDFGLRAVAVLELDVDVVRCGRGIGGGVAGRRDHVRVRQHEPVQ